MSKPFTDEDLKRAKENINDPYVQALLARLEAAERCLDGNTHHPLLDPKHYGACVCKDHAAWRKAKGETE